METQMNLFDQKARLDTVYYTRLRAVREQSRSYESALYNHDLVFEMLKPYYKDEWREKIMLLTLDTQSKITSLSTISEGSLDQCSCHISSVLRVALTSNAKSIILVHNHPGGATTPSQGDIKLTARIKEAATLCELRLLDHIVIAQTDDGLKYVSMAAKGLV